MELSIDLDTYGALCRTINAVMPASALKLHAWPCTKLVRPTFAQQSCRAALHQGIVCGSLDSLNFKRAVAHQS